MNTWEAKALMKRFPDKTDYPDESSGTRMNKWQVEGDSLAYPGVYSLSGFDVVSMLLHVRSRPNPTFHIGPVDCSVAFVICDLEQPDTPIVYATDAFIALTGYQKPEVIGRNCRFLQTSLLRLDETAAANAKRINDAAKGPLRKAIRERREIQAQLVNYNKAGRRFCNLLSIIPIPQPDASKEPRFIVGFQAELDGG
ncbi:hypothetical protein HIM_03663 [Hirsutella minnesotensis 3608]|uniref:PAS domain-containing protein n=1 Tax=Hirsutella minnesotensis 3608 TaxID=1043627 RepID=A0A0F7ZLY3_9HYPO|nr:hypothetical protein HIM_03663 [Hirsutella minnesotensis 3608]